MSYPLSLEASEEARERILSILDKLSDEAALRFTDAYEQCLADLCRRIPAAIEQGFPPTHDEPASLALSRPTYRAKFETTNKRSRFSSIGVWYVFFWLIDGDGDRIPETLKVVSIQHGSAPHLWEENQQS